MSEWQDTINTYLDTLNAKEKGKWRYHLHVDSGAGIATIEYAGYKLFKYYSISIEELTWPNDKMLMTLVERAIEDIKHSEAFPWYNKPSLLAMPKKYIAKGVEFRDAWDEIPPMMKTWLKESSDD